MEEDPNKEQKYLVRKKCQQSEWEGAVGKVGGKPGEWCVLEALRGAFQKERELFTKALRR